MENSYITRLRRLIIDQVSDGLSLFDVSKKYNIPLDDLELIYNHTISQKEENGDFTCNSIDDFIIKVGLGDCDVSLTDILRKTLEITIEEPELLDSLVDKLYPKLAKIFNLAEITVQVKLKGIYHYAFMNRNKKTSVFFEKYGIKRIKGVQLSKLISSSIDSIIGGEESIKA